MSETRFSVDYAKRVSKCKKCKEEITKESTRLAKLVPNYFSSEGEGELKQYYHVKCLFETFVRARATTKIIETADEIEGFTSIEEADKKEILNLLKSNSKEDSKAKANQKQPKKDENDKAKTKQPSKRPSNENKSDSEEDDEPVKSKKLKTDESKNNSKDNKFETFQLICKKIADESSHLKKSSLLKDFLKDGIEKGFLFWKKTKIREKNISKNSTKKLGGFKGNTYLFMKLLIPNATNRVYNLNSKQLVKLFSRIFGTDQDEMIDHLNKGDAADTVRYYFGKSNKVKPANESTLTLDEVDAYLDRLTEITKENDQLKCLEEIVKKCTKNDLQAFIRFIKKDLRIDAGASVLLDAINPKAYAAYQVSNNLKDVIERSNQESKSGLKKDLSIKVNLMTAVKPMLADACKSVEQAFQKCKNPIIAEVKYDGERLQIHKNGSTFTYYSRNLKAVQPHKTEYLKEFIPKAFPNANELILDGEVLLYCSKTKKPLPFGTLGVHKKNAFKEATVCLFVFDCIFMNGKDLMSKPLDERKKILAESMKEIPGRIMMSESTRVTKHDELRDLMLNAMKEGLEGLVLKDTKSTYEPGKRHWLKMKKDYLEEGTMADSADLNVLGAYYGTGNKGGMRSVFLMGAYNEKTKKWYTVTKVGNGFDDARLEDLQTEIEMIEIKKNMKDVPDWLVVDKTLVPDFVVKDPKKSQIWEISGAEFSESKTHTADGISIRFPRVTKVRDDKSWKEATNVERLKLLYKVSKEKTDIVMKKTQNEDQSSPEKAKRPVKVNKEESKKQKVSNKDSDQEDIIPSIFSEKKFFISKKVKDINQLKRYIRAYDGEVLDEALVGDASHVVVASNDEKIPEKSSKKVVKITDEDLWKMIKSKKFVNKK